MAAIARSAEGRCFRTGYPDTYSLYYVTQRGLNLGCWQNTTALEYPNCGTNQYIDKRAREALDGLASNRDRCR